MDCSIVSKFEKNFASDNLDEAEIILMGERHETGCTKIEIDFIAVFCNPTKNVVLLEGRDKSLPHELRSGVHWGGWDNGEACQYLADMLNKKNAGKIGDATWKEKKKIRDASLVSAVQEHNKISPKAKIFVIAGNAHLPTTLLQTFSEKKVLLLRLAPPIPKEVRKKQLELLREVL